MLTGLEEVLQAAFQGQAAGCHGPDVAVGRDDKWFTDDQGHLTERQDHLEAVPGIEDQLPAAGHGHDLLPEG